MSRFEYLSILVSIVIALAISELVQGWGALIRRRDGARPYGLHVAWTVLGLLAMVQWWWGFWQYREVDSWTFLRLFALVTNAVTVALFCYVLGAGHAAETDLRAHSWANHRWIFGLAAFAVVQLAALGVAVLATLAGSTSERLHAALTAASYLVFFGFVAVAVRAF